MAGCSMEDLMKPSFIVGVLVVGMVAVGVPTAATNPPSMSSQGGQAAKAVDYKLLVALLPSVPGWERGDVNGEQSEMMGMTFSRAEAEYNKGDVNVRLEITDTALIQGMLMPFTMMSSGLNEKTAEGYRRGTTVAGHPGWEEWENQTKNGDVNVLVAGRFIVHASGYDLPSMDPLKEIISALPAARLAALK